MLGRAVERSANGAPEAAALEPASKQQLAHTCRSRVAAWWREDLNVTVQDALATKISRVIREHDPLEPWLAESHWDEGYWDDEADVVADRVRTAAGPGDVRLIVLEVLRSALPESFAAAGSDARLDRRLDDIAAAIWQILQ